MKYAALTMVLSCKLVAGQAASSAEGHVLTFCPGPIQKFGLSEAQELADAERLARHGACGVSVFRERKGALWIFEARVGYAGAAAPDIAVIAPLPVFPSFPAAPEGLTNHRPLREGALLSRPEFKRPADEP